MNDKTIQPTAVLRVESVIDHFLKQGLTKDDLITIIQSRTNPKVNKNEIRSVIKVIREIERDFNKAQKK